MLYKQAYVIIGSAILSYIVLAKAAQSPFINHGNLDTKHTFVVLIRSQSALTMYTADGIPNVSMGGSGYVVNDTITLGLSETKSVLSAGNPKPVVVKVDQVSESAVVAVTLLEKGAVLRPTSEPVRQTKTSGTGSGAAFLLMWTETTAVGGKSQATYCTGAAIAKRAILTAAHCLKGHESASFDYYTDVFPDLTGKPAGSAHGTKEKPPFTYPKLSDLLPYKTTARGCGPCYDSNNNLHDIGLLFPDNEIDEKVIVQLQPPGRLDWGSIIGSQKNNPIIFSGYGLVDPEVKDGLRYRAAGSWHVDRADDWTISWSQEPTATVQSTCDGDSGGPAFLEPKMGHPTILAVTSTGDSGVCSSGTSTRVDPYRSWIDKKLKH
jgi:hypothetical protein